MDEESRGTEDEVLRDTIDNFWQNLELCYQRIGRQYITMPWTMVPYGIPTSLTCNRELAREDDDESGESVVAAIDAFSTEMGTQMGDELVKICVAQGNERPHQAQQDKNKECSSMESKKL